MGVLKELVRNVLAYYLVLSVLMSMLGKSSYKKYIEMFSGLVMILIVLNPLIKLSGAQAQLDLNLQKNQLYEVSQAESEDIMAAELKQSDAVLRQYQDTIAAQVCSVMENYDYNATEVKVTIDDSIESDSFGQVQNIEVLCKKGAEEESAQASAIEKVEIPEIKIGTKENIEKKVTDTLETKEAIVDIANMYGMDASKIKIQVEEDVENERR
ncbi:stage III sporulation protein AF [[Clostridium] polysaccharolyticum]|uniref:Stage III sporulation protein AF (Spore_III_AF) n=1 Tax=[Clostridium] polysaccharolyticum TaxID=29364 RepID=A0A1H9ZZK7_9FIRM|nr:stage III sporulation protein AF [[Clostridium] polysaccharolyticum]SES87271.1 Stage III sporulation protein AF (Spore_III_AF) [[Clostridium] polysaccharolyticum]